MAGVCFAWQKGECQRYVGGGWIERGRERGRRRDNEGGREGEKGRERERDGSR